MKGISPLIATVLLVAFTLTIGGIVSVFFTSFTSERQEEVSEKGSQTLDCTFSGIGFGEEDIEHNITAKSVNITARNTGQIDLYDLDILLEVAGVQHIYQPTLLTERNSTSKWVAGDTIALSANITDSPSGSLDSVTVISGVCPNNARKKVEL